MTAESRTFRRARPGCAFRWRPAPGSALVEGMVPTHKPRCAVLDDYQDVAATLADWSAVELTSFREHFDDEDALVAAIAECEVVVIMRERTPFPRSLFARLPKLKLLVTTGCGTPRSISPRPRSTG